MADDIWRLDATGQAELVRNGEVKPVELVETAIARAEAKNPTLNAIVTPDFDRARAAAGRELPNGPFRGVPFLVKDLIASVEGLRKTECCRFLRDWVADHDSELVGRYRRAGLVLLGMTNASEFGIVPTAEPHLFGPTKNPRDLARTTGGSSGGSAAAVAAGIVPMAHANDAGGSIRIPAAYCGLFGLKPTRARNPLGPDFGDVFGGLVQEHAVTRSVRDSAALLDATAGPAPGDPYWPPPAARPFSDEVGVDPGRLRIALVTDSYGGAPIDADCVAAARDAARLCEELGHHVEESRLPVSSPDRVTAAYVSHYAAGHRWNLLHWMRVTGRELVPDEFEPLTWALAEMGREQSSGDYLEAVETLQATSRGVARFFESYDVVLSPAVGEPPPALGTFESPPEAPIMGLFRAGITSAFATIANITGQPAMSVPLYENRDGLPIGTQFLGRFGDEAALFRLAAQLEQARPWRDRWPKLALDA